MTGSLLVPEIRTCGRYDSRIVFGDAVKVTKDRRVTCFEIELYTEDGGMTCLDGRDLPIRRGALLCAKPGSLRHSRLPLRCHYIYLDCMQGEIYERLLGLPDILTVQTQAYVRLFNELIALYYAHDGEDRYLLYGKALQLLHRLFRDARAGERPGPVPGNGAGREALLRAQEYIRAHFDQPITLEDIAAAAMLSPAYFHRLFSAYVGRTPYRYLLDLRIAHAKEMLLTTDRSLGDIAGRCGFASQSYFNHQFKKCVGQTPLNYRRQILSRLEV